VLHTAAARVGALDLGFVPGPNGKTVDAMLNGGVDLLWLLGADGFDPARIAPGTFVVYQGHHGDAGAQRADVILPGAAYTEKSGTYVNTEGRVQRGFAATRPPGEAREDWAILRAFSAVLGKPLPYDSLDQLRARLVAVNPVFGAPFAAAAGCTDTHGPAFGSGPATEAPFAYPVTDYYQTNVIARASATMAECSRTYNAPALQAAE
jgi:NADH-quinone oxidoreductase subunit G